MTRYEKRAVYNSAVPSSTSLLPLQPSSWWARLAAFLGFLAMVSALLAPVSMLAEEVRTGQLGGVCSATAAWSQSGPAGGDAAGIGPHCDMCASLGWSLPPQPYAALLAPPVHAVLVVAVPTTWGTAVLGLPFSRGPPAPAA